jgi:hypothetical protein
MPYSIGEKGSYGCSGYPVIKDDDKSVMGCHDTAQKAGAQIAAIEASESKNVGIKDPQEWPTDDKSIGSAMGQPEPASKKPSVFKPAKKKPKRNRGGAGGDSAGAISTTGGGTGMGTKADEKASPCWDGYAQRGMKPGENGQMVPNCVPISKSGYAITEGDFVMGQTTEGIAHGVVEHIMWEGGTLGTPGTEYALESMPPENPAMSVRVYEESDDDSWEPTAYSIGMMYVDATVVDMEDHDMDEMDDMEYMSKAEAYSPTSGMKSAARRALKWKAEGKATGAGTPVGWGRATDIVAGRSMSLSVVKRMYSFFSRHEVDKKGKDFYNTSNPSNGRIMWDAWGGDAGFSWSRAIAKRNEDKALFADFGKDFTRAERLSEIFKSIGVGSMVSWNSSGGRAQGKITRIIRNGSYDVPGTSVTVTGTSEDPAAVIRLYRDGEPTDTIVAHKIKTLRQL